MTAKVIAIDGPSAAGKSTVARRVAAQLGYLYVDSGAVYRGVAWYAIQHGLDDKSLDCLDTLLKNFPIEFFVQDKAIRFKIEGAELGLELRSERVNALVSRVAAMQNVRELVTEWLRTMRTHGPLVMEGRDIGTVVFPDAMAKFYLDADARERARRRHREISSDSEGTGYDEVSRSLERRDEMDSGREIAPLRVATDAVRIDTTHMTVDEVVEEILHRLKTLCCRATNQS
ncbi:MAG: (d)CMP kinase [Kiritimatiellia bacterium]